MTLTQRSARVVEARKLLQRKHRSATGRFLVEGPQAVGEALSAQKVVDLFCLPDRVAAYRDSGVPVHEADEAAIASLCQTVSPQGVVAVCTWNQPSLAEVLTDSPGLLVLMHEVADPGNLGTVIRVADAAGAAAVLLSSASVDPTNGKCVRASTGSVFHVPIVAAGATADVVDALQQKGFAVLAADVTPDSVDLFEAESRGLLEGPAVWLFGNEAHGLPDEILEQVDHVVRIPIVGSAESLNLATAAAVTLYASARARRAAR